MAFLAFNGYKEAPYHWKIDLIVSCSIYFVLLIVAALQIYNAGIRNSRSRRRSSTSARSDGTVPKILRWSICGSSVFVISSFLIKAIHWDGWGSFSSMVLQKLTTTLTASCMIVIVYQMFKAVATNPEYSSNVLVWAKTASYSIMILQFTFSQTALIYGYYIDRTWIQGIYLLVLAVVTAIYCVLMWLVYFRVTSILSKVAAAASQSPSQSSSLDRLRKYLIFMTVFVIVVVVNVTFQGLVLLQDPDKEMDLESRDFSLTDNISNACELAFCLFSLWFTWKKLEVCRSDRAATDPHHHQGIPESTHASSIKVSSSSAQLSAVSSV